MSVQKPRIQLVRKESSDLPSRTEAVAPPQPAADVAAPVERERVVGDLRLRPQVLEPIGAVLPDGLTVGEETMILGGTTVRFHRLDGASRYVALLYVDDGYKELTYDSWFLASLCLRIFTRANALKLAEPAVEILAARSGLFHEDWFAEAKACELARIAKAVTLRRIEPAERWRDAGRETATPLVNEWLTNMELDFDRGQGPRRDSFGSAARFGMAEGRAAAASLTTFEETRRRKSPLVFISYSHDDKELCGKLKECLAPLNDTYGTPERPKAVWTDEDLKTSDEWLKTIEEVIDSALVVVALATRSFFSSTFIKKVELETTLTRLKKGEKKAAWILGGACGYEVYGLNAFQAACAIDRPLNKLSQGEQDEQLEAVRKNVTQMIEDLLAKSPD